MLDYHLISQVLLPFAVAAVAFLYASVGHGGATGYLAVAALLGLAPSLARPGALWMNCIVSGIAFWRFQRAGCFDAKVFCPLALASIPCAWLGSQMHCQGQAYALLLAAALLATGWLLARGKPESPDTPARPLEWPLALAAGGSLGFLAGLTGIGGGVFLTPLLILLNWTPAKVAGGISALFILVNSLAGLAGLGAHALVWQPVFFWAVALGVAGACLGAYCGVNRWQAAGYRRALALVLWLGASKLLLTGK